MILAIDENGGQVPAQNAEKGKHYFCPVCNSRVILKKGPVKTAHYSHHHILDCIRYLYKRESAEHLELKNDLYLKMTPHYQAAMEFYLPEIEQIADVLVNKKLALEIQLSTISPQLILERTRGYASIGIDVVWVLEDNALKKDHSYILPTHFQMSTQKAGKIYTMDLKTKNIHVYHIRHHAGAGRFNYKKEKIQPEALIRHITEENIGSRKLTEAEIHTMISRERSKRTVQNLILTFLYQSGLTAETLPEHLKYSTPSDRLIINPPLEWKLFIYHHLDRGTFSMAAFKAMLEPRMICDIPETNTLARQLIKEYLMLYHSHKGSKLEISHKN